MSDKIRIFFDTEFIETPNHIELISIGLLTDHSSCSNNADKLRDEDYYAVNKDADLSNASDWVHKNVLIEIPNYRSVGNYMKYGASKSEIVHDINHIVGKSFSVTPNIEFWADFGSYDWVVFCGLFGRMVNLPGGYPMYVNDVQQLSRMVGCSHLDVDNNYDIHNALSDAKNCRDKYNFLRKTYEDAKIVF